MEISRLIGMAEIGLATFFVSCISSAMVIFFSNRFHIFIDKSDSNKPQRIHSSPTPRAGGIGIFLSFCLILLDTYSLGLYFLIGMMIILLSGLMEDFSGSLSPKIRLFIQLIGTAVAIFGMEAIITDLSPILNLPYFLGIALSLFGIIGVCNAINIIDGFNGLAGGICAMAFGAIGIAAWNVGCDFVLFGSIIGFGAITGFLVLNFPNGKIFLGDGGAYILGFVIAILLIILTQGHFDISAWFGLAVMIYPVWEVVFSIIRKKLKKKSPMQPDDKHFHMLVYQKVQSNPLTAVVLCLLNLPFMVLSVIFMHNAWALIAISLIFIIVYIIIYKQLNSHS